MELHLTPITLEQMHEHVFLAFAGDDKLLKFYHTSPGTLDHCVENTMKFITENSSHYEQDMEFYAVVLGIKTIGYTVIIRNEKAPHELYSFGINIKHRSDGVRSEWLFALSKLLGTPYYIVLWNRNIRAINFFERNGFAVLRTTKYLNDETKTLIVCRQEG